MKRTFVTGVIAVVALLGAACGSEVGSDGSSDTTAAPATTAAPTTDFVEGLNEVCTNFDEDVTAATDGQVEAIDEITAGRELDELSQDELVAVAEVLDESGADIEAAAEQFAADAEALGLPAEAQAAVDDAAAVIGLVAGFLPEMAAAVADGDIEEAEALGDELTESTEEELVDVAVAFDDLGVEACGSDSESFGEDGGGEETADPEAFVDDLNAICAEARATGDAEEEAFTDALVALQAADENGFAAGDPDYDRAIAEAVFALDTVISNSEAAIAQIEALDVPAGAEASLAEFIALQEESIDNAAELSAAFAADDGPAISALFDEAEATEAARDAERQALADELGAAECAPQDD